MSQILEVFSEIYKNNGWASAESISGPGSEIVNTRYLISELPFLLRHFNINSFLDLPCGDFNWMQHVDLSGVKYIGADIVPEIVSRNQKLFASESRQFTSLNLLDSSVVLPRMDAVFCRDCLVHLPLQDIFTALHNICNSGALYLITTSYSFFRHPANYEIQIGQWRRINLEAAPFHFPPPLKYIVEGSGESAGELCDKVTAVWSIGQIKSIVQALAAR